MAPQTRPGLGQRREPTSSYTRCVLASSVSKFLGGGSDLARVAQCLLFLVRYKLVEGKFCGRGIDENGIEAVRAGIEGRSYMCNTLVHPTVLTVVTHITAI